MKLQEQICALATIDNSERFFWCMHEFADEKSWKQNQKDKQEAVKILKETFAYSDDDIRQGIQFLQKLVPKEV